MAMAQNWYELDWYFEPDPIGEAQLWLRDSFQHFGASAVCQLLANGVVYSEPNACLRQDWLTFYTES